MNTLDKINNIKSTDIVDKLIFEKNLRINTLFIVVELDLMIIVLNNKKVMNLQISQYSKLKNATLEQLNNWTIIGGGVAIEWSDLDEDLSLKGFIQKYAFQKTLQTIQQKELTFIQ
jgi:hypothetical protein